MLAQSIRMRGRILEGIRPENYRNLAGMICPKAWERRQRGERYVVKVSPSWVTGICARLGKNGSGLSSDYNVSE